MTIDQILDKMQSLKDLIDNNYGNEDQYIIQCLSYARFGVVLGYFKEERYKSRYDVKKMESIILRFDDGEFMQLPYKWTRFYDEAEKPLVELFKEWSKG